MRAAQSGRTSPISATHAVMLATLLLSMLVARADTTPAPVLDSLPAAAAASVSDTVRKRVRAVEYSDWYARRLTVHRIGSYTMLPLFGVQYALGQPLMSANGSSSTKDAHAIVGSAIGALFTVN